MEKWSFFQFSEYLGNILIFPELKFSPPSLKHFSCFFLLLKDNRQPAQKNIYRQCSYIYIDIIFFILYMKWVIEVVNILIVTAPDIDSANCLLNRLFVCISPSLYLHIQTLPLFPMKDYSDFIF